MGTVSSSWAQSYCTPGTYDPYYMYISNVTLNGVSNSSGNGYGYEDFSSQIISAYSGLNLPVSITSSDYAMGYQFLAGR